MSYICIQLAIIGQGLLKKNPIICYFGANWLSVLISAHFKRLSGLLYAGFYYLFLTMSQWSTQHTNCIANFSVFLSLYFATITSHLLTAAILGVATLTYPLLTLHYTVYTHALLPPYTALCNTALSPPNSQDKVSLVKYSILQQTLLEVFFYLPVMKFSSQLCSFNYAYKDRQMTNGHRPLFGRQNIVVHKSVCWYMIVSNHSPWIWE